MNELSQSHFLEELRIEFSQMHSIGAIFERAKELLPFALSGGFGEAFLDMVFQETKGKIDQWQVVEKNHLSAFEKLNQFINLFLVDTQNSTEENISRRVKAVFEILKARIVEKRGVIDAFENMKYLRDLLLSFMNEKSGQRLAADSTQEDLKIFREMSNFIGIFNAGRESSFDEIRVVINE